MKGILVVSLFAIFLIGCQQASDDGQAEKKDAAGESASVAKNTIFFADGSGVELGGRVVRDSIIAHKGINMRRVVALFEDDLQAIDKSLHDVLKGAGYTKKVVSQSSDKIVCVYIKKGFPVLRAHYDLIQQGKKKSSRLILRWQV